LFKGLHSPITKNIEDSRASLLSLVLFRPVKGNNRSSSRCFAPDVCPLTVEQLYAYVEALQCLVLAFGGPLYSILEHLQGRPLVEIAAPFACRSKPVVPEILP
jgi:hypothetical protein